MAALTADRQTDTLVGVGFSPREFPVAASVEIFVGALVVIDSSGNAKPGVTETGSVGVGRALEHVDNSTGSAGDKTVRVDGDAAAWENSAGADEVGREHIGSLCYVVDDQTVAATDGSASRSPAGTVYDVRDSIPYVRPHG